MERKRRRVPVSWLHSHAYCEYSIYLEHGMRDAAKNEIKVDRRKDEVLDKEHAEVKELEIGPGNVLERALQEGVERVAKDVAVEGGPLYGIIDEIWFTQDQILIIDDRRGDFPYITDLMQIWGYCYTFEKQHQPNLPIFAVLRDRGTGKEVCSMPFLDWHRNEVLYAVRRIKGIVNGQIQAKPTNNPNKCRACRLRVSCDARQSSIWERVTTFVNSLIRKRFVDS